MQNKAFISIVRSLTPELETAYRPEMSLQGPQKSVLSEARYQS